MSSAAKERRREIVERIRDEGRAARRAGRHVQTNPYKDMDAYQWRNAWFMEDHAIAVEQADQHDESQDD